MNYRSIGTELARRNSHNGNAPNIFAEGRKPIQKESKHDIGWPWDGIHDFLSRG
jgi:hypothetical protein